MSGVLFPIFFFVSIVVFLVFLANRRDKIITETLSALGAKTDSLGRCILNKNGIPYWYRYTAGSRNSPPMLIVSIPCVSHGEFTINPEGGLDREAKKLGFSAEIQTGDAEFDDQYYIVSDTPEFARVYFQSAEKREVIKKIYNTGFTQVKHDGKTMQAQWSYFDKSLLAPELITGTADNLFALSDNLPDYFANEEILGIPRLRFKTIAAYAIPILALLAAGIGFISNVYYPPLDIITVFLRSLLLSVPLYIIYMVLVFFAIRGRAAAHKDFLNIAGVSLIAALFFVHNGFVFMNGKQDSSKPVLHNTFVTGKYITRSKNSQTYHVLVHSWRPGHDTEGFLVGEYNYRYIQPGQTEAAVVTKQGALGFEWALSESFNTGKK